MPKNLRIIKTSMRLPLKIISLRKPVADLQIENTNMNSILKYVWYENSKNSRCDLCAKIQTFETLVGNSTLGRSQSWICMVWYFQSWMIVQLRIAIYAIKLQKIGRIQKRREIQNSSSFWEDLIVQCVHTKALKLHIRLARRRGKGTK